ncbi:regulatory sensor-transducer, BlaR1/MecR1 family protein [Flavobacterium rakeshii]|uniref:Regulatory sensor-transducer, BlaR1/MecR1 family protein n=1 Tax=Flavobacterium rakeshii TaxID=1038845 RepID=A0A6N8HA64_9FLAO|nr:M56 family metallopeptidase [Flavobacterium rakeshii]MUV02750.1 regulatory sensor-transducer, BlaR1/MecR1 family protein [Flavobacterium rakeshii]
MTEFLIKSGISMVVLLGVYKLLLEKEKMHRFNRIYLLASLIFSVCVPFISIPSFANYNNSIDTLPQIALNEITITRGSTGINTRFWLILTYIIITSSLIIRFLKNILSFVFKIKNNKKIKYKTASLILLPYNTLPHTFLNYIFISEDDHNKNAIEKDLYTHELAHVNQMHTMDILLIELFKTLFWFNPVLYFYKKSIQLNHEFLADDAVINNNKNTAGYQNLLLKMASGSHTVALASNINFSITKKRFVMMTKTTPRFLAISKQLLVVPVMAGLFLISCAENEVKPEPETNSVQEIPNVIEEDSVKPEVRIPGPPSESDEILSTAGLTLQPEYPGGMPQFYNYINENFTIPDVKENKTLKIYISFVVEKDGSMSNIKVLRDPGYGAGEEAIRVLKSVPEKWMPGEMDGKSVRSSFTLPITINIHD